MVLIKKTVPNQPAANGIGIMGIQFLADPMFMEQPRFLMVFEQCSCGEYSLCRKLRTVQLKACDAGKASNVASLLQEAKDAKDPVRGRELRRVGDLGPRGNHKTMIFPWSVKE